MTTPKSQSKDTQNDEITFEGVVSAIKNVAEIIFGASSGALEVVQKQKDK